MAKQTSADHAIQFAPSLQRRVEAFAQATGATSTQVVQEALEQYLTAHEGNGGRAAPDPPRRLADMADAIAATIPTEEWDKLPVDLAKNFEHYRYGYPRED